MSDDIRTKLLKKFREIGVSQIEVYYSGYGDSGQLDDILTKPAKVPLDEIEFDTITSPWRPDEVIERNLGEALENWLHSIKVEPWMNPSPAYQRELMHEISTDQ